MSEKSKKRTVKDIDHTHPHTDEPFGTSGVYDRGKNSDEADEDATAHPDDGHGTDRARAPSRRRRVKDIDHTPPDEVGAQRTFDRGEETPEDERRSADVVDGEDRDGDSEDREEGADDAT